MLTSRNYQPPSIQFRRDQQGRIVERSIHLEGRLSSRLGNATETRRYAYGCAGRLARVTDETGALCESYQYDHQGRRLAEINPQRFRGERRYTSWGTTAWARPGAPSTATTRRASAT